jgi:UDP-N-acetylglucosamine 4,6-dehydratase
MEGLVGTVLVTGGTGSLGKATLLTAEREKWPVKFVIFSRDETKQSNLRKRFPQHRYILGDVAKYSDIGSAVRGTKPETILHYAAYKQVPAAQNNVNVTIETNIIGSQNVVNAALEYGVKQVVASSTDKACQSVNVYGNSKAAMECVFQDANKWGSTTFHLARYGNVVASNSSVIPFFLDQIKSGGPITVTDKRMTRFWISLKTAVGLICEALKQEPGIIVVPKAPALNVWTLAEYLRYEYGTSTIEIKDVGIRPGEKLHECMVSEAESFHTLDRALDPYFYIYPPTTEVHSWGTPFSYSSNEPGNWLMWEDMKKLIEESRELGS